MLDDYMVERRIEAVGVTTAGTELAREIGEAGGSLQELQALADRVHCNVKVLMPEYRAGYKAWMMAPR
jgi:hypothetical protein